MCRAALVGLLAIQAEASPAENASADLRVSATISSICAVSSGPSIVPRRDWATARATARVHCAPDAAFTLSFDPRIAREEPSPAPSAMPVRRAERESGVLVMEIAY